MGDDERVDSMCAIYADLIENELASPNPDDEKVASLLDNIRQYCTTVSFAPGETPEHLEPFTFDEGRGEGEKGTVVYEGKEIPAAAVPEESDG